MNPERSFFIMAKRFIDTEIFKKKWIRDLPTEYKLLYIYILTDCNHWGVWEVDLEVAAIRLRCPEIQNAGQKILEKFGPQIDAYREDRWWIVEFCDFQYGPLKETNRMHLSVIEGLKKENLYKKYVGASKPLISPLQGVKDKEQYKDKDKDKDKRLEKFKNEVYGFEQFKTIAGEFILYWSEPNKTGTRMRFEMEKTWDTKRRLQRWSGNSFGKQPEETVYKSKALTPEEMDAKYGKIDYEALKARQ